MLSHNALVIVADGHQAILLRNTAKHGIELAEVERFGPRELQDESQGRQPEETTPRDEDEATFAKQLTERLNRSTLILPLFHQLAESDQQRVVDVLRAPGG